MQFRFGLHIDLGNAGLDGEGDFGLGLADAGENDPLRWDAGGQRAPHLSLGHHVGPRPQIAERPKHRDVGVGLHRKGD